MSRKPRLEFPGAIYHINHRGNHQEHIYRDNDDRKLFLKLLKTTIQRMNWICHAYCLMGNHYHILIEIPEGILSRGMA
ncbi:MAG: transposase, partial [bacterium]|nr:transposase [bacterium]